MNQMIKTSIVSLFLSVSFIFPTYAWQLKPFETTYSATISKIPFDGQATYSLTKQANQWHFHTQASMAIAQRVENSSFVLKNGAIQPSFYKFEQSGIRPKEVSLSFDWKKMFAKGHFKDRKHDDDMFFDLKYSMLDQLSTQLALQIDIANGKKQMSYRVIEDDKLDTYKFKVVAEETIETPVGKLVAVKVQRVRDTNSKRQSYIWFAKDWNYTVVRLYHLEKNGQEYVISLAHGTVDGKEIKGK
ncbi:DUF3108 domain-containing protein [Entomomonas asaccharolytica]|uniref:DUF3108 domain-containing protein n=1 Tax=Entomomonas asaccharolytica TaxID=2785331 RepID=A0A974NFZ5_9GAMM|nr:DUF3108 domain-containing protein [Entomomonas asaccharolytica]QQP85812.1 DUF3108 domain-containing protein [Entomomonas asaccharolytica]